MNQIFVTFYSIDWLNFKCKHVLVFLYWEWTHTLSSLVFFTSNVLCGWIIAWWLIKRSKWCDYNTDAGICSLIWIYKLKWKKKPNKWIRFFEPFLKKRLNGTKKRLTGIAHFHNQHTICCIVPIKYGKIAMWTVIVHETILDAGSTNFGSATQQLEDVLSENVCVAVGHHRTSAIATDRLFQNNRKKNSKNVHKLIQHSKWRMVLEIFTGNYFTILPFRFAVFVVRCSVSIWFSIWFCLAWFETSKS